MPTLTLTEYEPRGGIRLTADEVAALSTLGDKLGISPESTPGSYRLTPSSWVGAISRGDLRIAIGAKVPAPRLMFLLGYHLDPAYWSAAEIPLEQEAMLVDAVVPTYLAHLKRAFRFGVLQGYRVEDDALMTVRGRIRFEDQLRLRQRLMPPIEVTFDEFTEDIELNRLLRAAGMMLLRLCTAEEPWRSQLLRVQQVLEAVALVDFAVNAVPPVAYNRLNQHYRAAVELSRWILQHTSLELRHGDVIGTEFLVDMNLVFEEFVRNALREALRLREDDFPSGERCPPLWLDRAHRLRLRPDLSWWAGGRCLLVGDVKYKVSTGEGGKTGDVYQLLAYLVATGLQAGTLIYASSEPVEPTVHHLDVAGKRVVVATVDLGQAPARLLDQISELGQQLLKTTTELAA